ncbi:WD40-repeat-containing domain protein [Linnemannia elongata]|nr:WD40-repeat-containing domain protein [Linnemannia elongata]
MFSTVKFELKPKKSKAKKGKAKKDKNKKEKIKKDKTNNNSEGISIPPSSASDRLVSQSPAKPASTATHVDNHPSDDDSSSIPSSSWEKKSAISRPTSSPSTATRVGDDLSADNNSVLSSGTQKNDSISQPSTMPAHIVNQVESEYSRNSKSIITPGTVQYWPPTLQPQQPSCILSEGSSDPPLSNPLNPPRAPSAIKTVQDTDAMYQSRNSLSQGLNRPSVANRPAPPRTVQGPLAVDQPTHLSTIISQSDRSPLIKNQPVAPTVSQPVPSSDNRQALSFEGHFYPSSNSQSASPCDNQPPLISNNQSVTCSDIQPVSSSPEENASLLSFSTKTHTLSALPKEQIPSHPEQQTGTSTLKPHSIVGEVLVAAFTSDGRHILSCPRHQGLVQWDSRTGARVPLPHEMTCGVCAFTISPNGAQVATGCFDGLIRLWRGQAYEAERALLGNTCAISKLVYSPCGRWLVSCDINGTVRLWDVIDNNDQGEIIETGACNGIFKDVVFAPTGHEFRTLSDCLVRFYDPRYRNPCKSVHEISLDHPIYPLDYSQDGLRIVYGSGYGSHSVHVNDPQLGSDFELKGHGHEVVCAAFSPCGERILTGSRDKKVFLWLDNIGSWSRAAVALGCSEAITCLAWNPVNPKEFVTGCRDGSVRVWRVSSAEAGDVSVKIVWGAI